MNCVMTHDPGGNDHSRTLMAIKPKARKVHICGECMREILPGEHYELHVGTFEGEVFRCETCLDCLSIRESFFGNSNFQFESMLEEVREYIIYGLAGEVDSRCIIPLTPRAKDMVFEYMEEGWKR